MNKASVSISDWGTEGKNQGSITNRNGEFNLQGLMEGSIEVFASANGYAVESRTAQVKLGEVLENVDFILGQGKVTLKGRILSNLNNQAIKGAVIGIFSDSKGNSYSGGMDFSNENGFYSMKGLREPGIFTVQSGHKDYKILKTKVDLKIGENIIDFHLEPKEELIHEKRSNEYSARGASGTSYSRKCKCIKGNLENAQEDMCQKLKEKKDDCKEELGSVLECLLYRCEKRNYKIKCKKECKDRDVNNQKVTVCAGVKPKYVGTGKKKKARITICLNNIQKKECGALSNRILHGLYHVCDLDAKKTHRACAEARTHEAMLCMFGDNEDFIMYIQYYDECEKKKKKDEEKKQ